MNEEKPQKAQEYITIDLDDSGNLIISAKEEASWTILAVTAVSNILSKYVEQSLTESELEEIRKEVCAVIDVMIRQKQIIKGDRDD